MYSAAGFSAATLVVDLAFALSMVCLGTAAGWWLGRRRTDSSAADAERARLALNKLHELAFAVAEDVGQHSSRVQEISSELNSAKANDGGGEAEIDDFVINSVTNILLANERLQQQLATAEVQIQRQAAEIENRAAEARTDALTGIFNRRAFDDELTRRYSEWSRRKTIFSLVMLDVDYFKQFNDRYGHQAGDLVLQGIAQVLQSALRDMDFLARYGGEEFSIVLPVTSLDEAVRAAHRLKLAIESSVFHFNGSDLRVTISSGVAQIMPGDDTERLVKRADEALYASKTGGRNCIHVHDGTACIRPTSAVLSPAAPGGGTAAGGESNGTTGPAKNPSPVADSHSASVAPALAQPSPNIGPRLESAPVKGSAAAPSAKLSSNELAQMLNARPTAGQVSLMLVDLDDFKQLHDRLGPAIGALLLDTISEFLSSAVDKRHTISRRGIGQFSVAMPGTNLNMAVDTAERVRAAIAACAMEVKGAPLRLTVSIGVAAADLNDDSDSLFLRARGALEASKAAGRNCTFAHDGERAEPADSIAAAR